MCLTVDDGAQVGMYLFPLYSKEWSETAAKQVLMILSTVSMTMAKFAPHKPDKTINWRTTPGLKALLPGQVWRPSS